MGNKKVQEVSWSLAQLWNEVAFKTNRPLVKRDYIFASEIGSPLIDRYYKMNAVPYTNPPNNRSLRKFLAGNIWEYVVKQILLACGVFKRDEVKCDATPYKGCLDVHGRLDFKAGGYIDKDEAMANISVLQLPDFLLKIAERIITSLAGGTLEEMFLELKAVSTFAMDLVERRRCAIPQHTLQGYHYQKYGKLRAEVAYICKDDCRMAQFGIDVKATEKLYKKDIEEMSFFYLKKKVPPREPLAKFDPLLGNFGKHLGVEYSPYLTKIYGFETPDHYRMAVAFTAKWNRALARFALVKGGGTTPSGQLIKLTEKNWQMKYDIEAAGFNFDECLRCKIAAGVAEEEVSE